MVLKWVERSIGKIRLRLLFRTSWGSFIFLHLIAKRSSITGFVSRKISPDNPALSKTNTQANSSTDLSVRKPALHWSICILLRTSHSIYSVMTEKRSPGYHRSQVLYQGSKKVMTSASNSQVKKKVPNAKMSLCKANTKARFAKGTVWTLCTSTSTSRASLMKRMNPCTKTKQFRTNSGGREPLKIHYRNHQSQSREVQLL